MAFAGRSSGHCWESRSSERRRLVTCPICLDYFIDPVTTDCGHNFCRACLTKCWGEPDRNASCPQCRELLQQSSLRPNRKLANIAEISKKSSLRETKGKECAGRICELHQEPLKLFCRDDKAPICVVCDRSKEHREHRVIPTDEAAEEYQGTQDASPNKATQPPPTMASAPPVTDVEEEAQCPICKELFTDPVTLNCGHNFCRGCITQYCDIWEHEGKLECPACRVRIKDRNFHRNYQLANIVENVQRAKKHLCVKHKKELNLFCKGDDELVCVACWRSPEHESHIVRPLEEAAQEYKENIQEQLQSLQKKREELEEQKVAEEQRIQECLLPTASRQRFRTSTAPLESGGKERKSWVSSAY